MRYNLKKPYHIKMVQIFILIGKGINNTILLKFKYFYVYKISLWSKKISYSIIKVTFEEKIRKKHTFYCYVTPSQIVRKNIFFQKLIKLSLPISLFIM